ncbi:ABM domain-containing protein [Fusarium falciforme]|uniref:ABM domain-containing protein n=1 Tax=Fusarium falciforme TaxID=195108 RepID=UPI0023001E07|nr:ABM domain-containing protein [Fusarium falciforme]WAO96193.1 ABM domain-containing protein [Fusarium falciforme]
MARPTTEFAVLSLVPGANLVDPESEGSRIWRDCLKTLSSFEGFRSSLYSVDEKNTNTMVEIVDWESIEAHQAATESPKYGPFLEKVSTILAGPPNLKHAMLNVYGAEGELSLSPPAAAFKGTPTVIQKFYFPASVDAAAVDASALEMVHSLRSLKGFKAAATGWLLEDVEHQALGGSAGKGFVLVTGWENSGLAREFSTSLIANHELQRVGAKADEGFVANF